MSPTFKDGRTYMLGYDPKQCDNMVEHIQKQEMLQKAKKLTAAVMLMSLVLALLLFLF